MENIKESVIVWLDMLKALSALDYEIVSSTDKWLKVLVEIDNNKYMIDAYKV